MHFRFLFILTFLLTISPVQAKFSDPEKALDAAHKSIRAGEDYLVTVWYAPTKDKHGSPQKVSYIGLPSSEKEENGEFDVEIDWDYNGNFVADGAFNSKNIHGIPIKEIETGYYYVMVVKGYIKHLTLRDVSKGYKDIKDNLFVVTNLGDLGYKSFKEAFANCSRLLAVSHFGNFNIAKDVTDASYMFSNTPGLLNVSLDYLFLRSVTTAKAMFQKIGKNVGSTALRVMGIFPPGSKLIDMEQMFHGSAIRSTDGWETWDTSGVKKMGMLFANTRIGSFSGIENWDVSNVVDFGYTFVGANLDPLPTIANNWNTKNAKRMSGMFAKIRFSKSHETLGLDTTNVWKMDRMFAQAVNPPMRGFKTDNVENLFRMYKGAKIVEGDLNTLFSGWNLGSLKDASDMFYQAQNQRLSVVYSFFLNKLHTTGSRTCTLPGSNKSNHPCIVNLTNAGSCGSYLDCQNMESLWTTGKYPGM